MMLHTESDTSGSARRLNLLNNSTALVPSLLLQPGLSGALMKAAREKRAEAQRHTEPQARQNHRSVRMTKIKKAEGFAAAPLGAQSTNKYKSNPKRPFDWSSKLPDHNTHDPKSSKSIWLQRLLFVIN